MPTRDDVYTISADDITESAEDLIQAATGHRSPGAGRFSRSPRGFAGAAATRAHGGLAMSARASKRPVVASTLSLFLCGAGQLYNRQVQLGLLFFLTEALFVAGHWSARRMWPAVCDFAAIFGVGETQLCIGAAAADGLMILIAAWSVYQAYYCAERTYGYFDGFGSPIASGLGSMLVPGWGQVLNAQVGKGMLFLVFLHATVLALAYTLLSPLSGFLMPNAPFVLGLIVVAGMTWVLSVYDAVLVAGFRRHLV